MLGYCGDGAAHDMCSAEARQTLFASANEYRYRLVPSDATFAQQTLDCCNEVAGQRNHTLLATFAAEQDL
jgi:hypothetical protein